MKKFNITTKTTAAAAFILAIALALTGCKSKNADKITFALDWTPNTNHTGLYVAQAKGFFAEEGLSVDIVQPSEDGATMMVATNVAQFGVDFQDTIAPALISQDKIPVTAVAALLQHNTSGLISLKSAGIDSPKKLEGHTYATWNSPVELATIQSVMQDDGGDFSKVSLIPTSVYDIVTALNADIDCVWIYYAWDGVKMDISGYETNFLDFGKLDKRLDYYTPLITANTEYLEKNGEQAKKFLKALRKGYEYAVAHPEEAAEILCAAAPELDKDLVLASQKWINSYYIADAPYWGYIDSQRWNGFYSWLNEKNLLGAQLELNQGFTDDYLDNRK